MRAVCLFDRRNLVSKYKQRMSLRAASDKAGRPGWRMRITRWQIRSRPRLPPRAGSNPQAASRNRAARAQSAQGRAESGKCWESKVGRRWPGRASRSGWLTGVGRLGCKARFSKLGPLPGPSSPCPLPPARLFPPAQAAALIARRSGRPGFAADSRAIYPQFFPELIARYAVFTSDAGLMLI